MGMIGQPTKIVEWIRGENVVVWVEVDVVVPEFDSSEPCLEPEAIPFLGKVQDLANRGMVGELEKLGEVYVRRSA